MQDDLTCPKCNSENIYFDGSLYICPDCSLETSSLGTAKSGSAEASQENVIKDAHGNILADGDSVTVIKDLKIKGSSSSVKVGTKVKNIRLVDSSDGHNIACKIDGFGAMNLKSEFVKKA
jgi:protein PhnA